MYRQEISTQFISPFPKNFSLYNFTLARLTSVALRNTFHNTQYTYFKTADDGWIRLYWIDRIARRVEANHKRRIRCDCEESVIILAHIL